MDTTSFSGNPKSKYRLSIRISSPSISTVSFSESSSVSLPHVSFILSVSSVFLKKRLLTEE